MRILWVKAGKILPVDTGGRIRSFNILRHLAARHETTLLSYYAGARDETYERALTQRLPGAVPLAVPGPAGPIGQLAHYARHVPSPAPYAVTKFTDAAVRQEIVRIVRDRRIDVVVCDFLSASLNLPVDLQAPAVLFQHNVESALWDRQARHEPNLAKRVAFKMEAAKMRRYEAETVARYPRVIAVSEHDRALMSAMTDPARITVVPTGVDVEAYGEAATVEPEPNTVLFLGSMDWEANIDGVDFFCREVWPTVTAAVPGARFRVVGRNPHPRIQKLASDSVEIVGGVPSVVPYLAQAAAFVVPLRVGGGTRLKIYEAMAAGRAIVSTRVGAEGLDYTDGEDILIADRADELASAVIRLLGDDEARRRLSRGASATAARFDWSAIARQFEQVLDAARGAPAPALAPSSARPASVVA